MGREAKRECRRIRVLGLPPTQQVPPYLIHVVLFDSGNSAGRALADVRVCGVPASAIENGETFHLVRAARWPKSITIAALLIVRNPLLDGCVEACGGEKVLLRRGRRAGDFVCRDKVVWVVVKRLWARSDSVHS